MAAEISKTQRWLDLIVYLVGRRTPATVDEIMEAVPAYREKWLRESETDRATARRTFERDKDELRRHGIPLQTVVFTVNYGREQLEGYQIRRRDFYLPYLNLVGQGPRDAPAGAADAFEIHEDEARLALDALRRVAELPSFPLPREARSAFRKLTFDLGPDTFAETPALYVDRPGAAELAVRLRVLSDALLARRRVRFRYRGMYRGEETERDVKPYGLLFQGGYWYLVAHDALRDAVRVFRVGRMEDLEPVGPERAYDVPASFRLEEYANRRAWELGGDGEEPPVRAKVSFRFPASLVAERNRYGTLLEKRADGSAVRAFEVAQVHPFLRWLLSLEGEAEVLEPPEMAHELRRMAAEVARLHRRGGKGAGGRAGRKETTDDPGEVRKDDDA